jgi:hypothetical protein
VAFDATPRAGAFARAGQCDERRYSERPTEKARSGVFRAGIDGCDDVSMPVICPTAQDPLEKICSGATARQVQLKELQLKELQLKKLQLKKLQLKKLQLKKPAAVAPARASIFPTMNLCH